MLKSCVRWNFWERPKQTENLPTREFITKTEHLGGLDSSKIAAGYGICFADLGELSALATNDSGDVRLLFEMPAHSTLTFRPVKIRKIKFLADGLSEEQQKNLINRLPEDSEFLVTDSEENTEIIALTGVGAEDDPFVAKVSSINVYSGLTMLFMAMAKYTSQSGATVYLILNELSYTFTPNAETGLVEITVTGHHSLPLDATSTEDLILRFGGEMQRVMDFMYAKAREKAGEGYLTPAEWAEKEIDRDLEGVRKNYQRVIERIINEQDPLP